MNLDVWQTDTMNTKPELDLRRLAARPIWPLLVLISILALAACSAGQTQPQAAQPLPVATKPPLSTGSTQAAAPSATALPSPMAVEATPTQPAPAESDNPTATPMPAPTDTLPPAPTATPTLAPTATPSPVDLSALNLAMQPVAAGFSQPVFATHAGDGSGRIFVLEKAGRIVALAADGSNPRTFLDISDRVGSSSSEQGLLGLAFDADFAANGRLFVYYTDTNGDTVIARFAANAGRTAADPASEVILLTAAQPAANHNGGIIAFGPDGYLYAGLGDGGAANDRFGHGQNLETILGAVIRIDVSGDGAVVPADNPFVGREDARPEIWAYGLRNPWRFSFDRQTGDLWIADVGQNQWEEVNVRPASSPGGENYGWPIMEGTHCFQADTCQQDGLILPVAEYSHDRGCSVTGGYVYRGAAQPSLQGIYFYGDYCSGRIWGLAQVDGQWQNVELLSSGAQISSFGETEDGEVLVVDYSGNLSRLVNESN
jgi:glucose/arabinose dehydrogenase